MGVVTTPAQFLCGMTLIIIIMIIVFFVDTPQKRHQLHNIDMSVINVFRLLAMI